jgi:Fe-S-cluster-containing dehydrogenase component
MRINMKKWNLIIDIEKCENCNNCLLACKDEFVDNEFRGYSALQPKHGHQWITIQKKERGKYPLIDVSYLPAPCFHCDDAPCIKAAKDGSIYKRDDGIVIIDPDKAKGNPDLVKSCPYGAIWWNETEKLAQKCTLCAHLLDDNWKEPRCVSVCPTSALRIEKVDDARMQHLVKEEELNHYKANQNTKPRVYYKNLHRFTDCFIGGSVAATKGEVTDCVENANVILQKSSGDSITETKTDIFGDFKFDHIETNSGSYIIQINHPEYEDKAVTVELTESVNVGVISLT